MYVALYFESVVPSSLLFRLRCFALQGSAQGPDLSNALDIVNPLSAGAMGIAPVSATASVDVPTVSASAPDVSVGEGETCLADHISVTSCLGCTCTLFLFGPY